MRGGDGDSGGGYPKMVVMDSGGSDVVMAESYGGESETKVTLVC